MADEWIAVNSATALLMRAGYSARDLREALSLGEARGRGVPVLDCRTENEGFGEPQVIPAKYWATWHFHPERQSLDPPSRRRIASGYHTVRISREDVARLAQPATAAEPTRERATLTKSYKKPTKEFEAAQALKAAYPNGRPAGVKYENLAVIAAEKIGAKVSESTLKRAIPKAWPGSK